MVIQKNCEFVKNSATPTVSKAQPNASADTLTLSVYGAKGKYYLEGRNTSQGDWVALAGINLNDFSVARGIITEPGIYEFGIVGIREVQVRVEEAEGEVSIFGQMISTGEA